MIPVFLNGKKCETDIVDKVDEIAKSILAEYGWQDHPTSEYLVDYMSSEAKWESDMSSTREVMLEVFMREKEGIDLGIKSNEYYAKLKEHNHELAMKKLTESN